MSHPVAAVMAVTSVASAVMQGVSAEAQAKADQLALENEKEQLLQQRKFLAEARDEELDLFKRETNELLGLQTVGFAKSGVELSGSVVNVLNQTRLDALEEEERIYQQYDRYRSISEIKERSLSNQITSIRYQRGLITPTTMLGMVSGGTQGWYKGRSLTKSKSKKKVT